MALLYYTCRPLDIDGQEISVLTFMSGEVVAKVAYIVKRNDIFYYAVEITAAKCNELQLGIIPSRGHGVVDFREIEFFIMPLAAEAYLQEAAQDAYIQDLATFEAFVIARLQE